MAVTFNVEAAGGAAQSITNIIGRVASFGVQALPVAQFVAGFFPGMAPVLQAIQIAQPILAKIVAYSPQVSAAIASGVPIAQSIEDHGPDVLSHLKELYAIAVNHDPARPEMDMAAEEVTNAQASTFGALVFTPGRTNAEQQQEWDRAVGAS